MNDSFEKITRDIKTHNVAPVYLLHGEESFFIDRIVEEFESYLPEEERDFNLFTIYALEKTPDDVMDIARRFPMLADKTVVLIKEVQAVKNGAGKWINRLAKYASNPSSTTIFVVVARGTSVSCKEFTDALRKSKGVIFESNKLKDAQLPTAINNLVKNAGLHIEPKSVEILVENIGNDLSKLYNEINKLKLILPPASTITPECIEANIGISRDYNNFELNEALAARDTPKALKIIRHFNLSQRENPWGMTISSMYNLYSKTLIAYYTPRNDSAIMAALNLRWPKALTIYKTAMRNYSPSQLIEIISLIREADANGKGNGSRLHIDVIMENLILKIFMAKGTIN